MQKLSERAALGKKGETFVAQWLQERGYRVCVQNFRTRGGEIDLIVQKNELVAFVEVKYRKYHYFDLSEVITKSKQQKIAYAAQSYMIKYGKPSFAYRFDVALVEGVGDNCTISYIENAFTNEFII